MFGRRKYIADMKLKRIFSFFLMLVMLLTMFPTAYATGEVTNGEVPTEGVQSTETQQMESEPTEGQDEYAVSPLAVADKYAYLGNCDDMDIILSNGVRQGWHFADEDQKYPWDYMNMVYCLEAGKQFSVGTGNSGDSDVPLDGTVTNDSTIGERCWFKLSAEQRMAIALVILYGCPTKLWDAEWGLNPEGTRIAENPNIGYRFATQALVWEFASGWREPIPPYTLKISQWRDLSIGVCMNEDKTVDHFLYAYESILNDMLLHNVIPSFAGHFQNSAPEIQLTGNAVTLTDTNGVLSRFTFTDMDTVAYRISGNDLTISVSGAVPADVQCATATLPDPEASIYELWYNGYTSEYQTAIKVSVPASDPVPAYFKLKTSTGSLSLKKTTEDGKNLEGWKFSIYSDSACKNLLSGPHTTNAKGELSVSGLSAGTVYVKEIGHTDPAIDALYECTSENPQKVNIVSGQTATVTFNNDLRSGYGKIVKTTNTGKNLAGWKFNLYTDEALTQKVSGSPFTTGDDGVITVELTPGDYWCQEVDESSKYPDWDFDTSVKKITIKANETATVTYNNTHYGYAKLIKQTNTGSNLSGWKINVYMDAACTKPISGSPFTTGTDGTITVRLTPGDYWCREVDESSTHPDWIFDTSVKKVTVKAGQTASVTFSNSKLGRAKLIKVMPDGGPLGGWVFEVYRKSDGVLMGTYTSGEDGTILTGFLDPGEYEVFEQIPEESLYYCETPNPQTVTIVAGETAEVTFTNRLKDAQILVYKIDPQGAPMSGAEFLLEWSENGVTWAPVTYTDSENVSKGTCTSEGLVDGKQESGRDGVVHFTGLHPELLYRLTETKAPEGYQLLTEPAYEGRIDAEETLIVELTVVNAPVFELPMTGSTDSTVASILQIAGAIVLLIVLLYIAKKRR